MTLHRGVRRLDAEGRHEVEGGGREGEEPAGLVGVAGALEPLPWAWSMAASPKASATWFSASATLARASSTSLATVSCASARARSNSGGVDLRDLGREIPLRAFQIAQGARRSLGSGLRLDEAPRQPVGLLGSERHLALTPGSGPFPDGSDVAIPQGADLRQDGRFLALGAAEAGGGGWRLARSCARAGAALA